MKRRYKDTECLENLKKHFIATDQKHYTGNYFYYLCIKCSEYAALTNDGSKVDKIIGRREGFRAHLRKCIHHNPSPSLISIPSKDHEIAQRMIVSNTQDENLTTIDVIRLENVLLDFFIDNQIPFQAVDRPSCHRLLTFIRKITGKYLPTANKLATDILDRQYEQQRASKLDQFDAYADMGRIFTITCDHWQHKSNNHIIGVMIQTINRWINFDDGHGQIITCDKNNASAIASQLERIITAVTLYHYEYHIRALCTTDTGKFATARRMLALRYPHWIFTRCMAYQINSMVKDALNIIDIQIIVQAVMIERTFNQTSSTWLKWLNKEILALYQQTVTLISFEQQRWDSLQAFLASFLRIRSAMLSFHSLCYQMKDYPQYFSHLSSSYFWNHLQQAECMLRPLTELSFRINKSDVFLSDIIYMYGRLFRLVGDNVNCCSRFRQMLENRFRKEEHPLLLLTFCLDHRYFDLYIQLTKTSNHAMLQPEFICNTAVYYYKKFLGKDNVQTDHKKLINQMYTYLQHTSNDQQTQNVVYPFDFWWLHESQQDQLCQLAKFLLSIVTQTATCQRLFSKIGYIDEDFTSILSTSRIHKLQELSRLNFEDYQAIANIKSKLISSKELRIVTEANGYSNYLDKISKDYDNKNASNHICAQQSDDVGQVAYMRLFQSWMDALSSSDANDSQEDTDLTDDLDEEEKSPDISLLAKDAIRQIKFDDRANIRHTNAIPTPNANHYPREKLKYFRGQKISLQDLFDNSISLPYIA